MLTDHRTHLIKVVEIYGAHLSWAREISKADTSTLKHELDQVSDALIEMLGNVEIATQLDTVMYGEYSARLDIVRNLLEQKEKK